MHYINNMKSFIYFKLYLLVLIPIIIWCIPVSFFETGSSICIITLITRKHCWGCGMTRAFVNIIHFHFKRAYSYNHLCVLVFPLLTYEYIKYFLFLKKATKQ